MREPNNARLPERQRKVCGYLYMEGDVQEPQETAEPFLAVIRDRKGHLHLRRMPPSNPPNAARRRWQHPSPAALRVLRKRAGLTQEQAAALCLSGTSSWKDWESGRRQMHPVIFHVFSGARRGFRDGSMPTPQKLNALRAEAGITQARAAKLCHSNWSAWRGWESGREPMPPGLYKLFFEELADAYGIASSP